MLRRTSNNHVVKGGGSCYNILNHEIANSYNPINFCNVIVGPGCGNTAARKVTL